MKSNVELLLTRGRYLQKAALKFANLFKILVCCLTELSMLSSTCYFMLRYFLIVDKKVVCPFSRLRKPYN